MPLSFKMAGNTILDLLGLKVRWEGRGTENYNNILARGTEVCGKLVAHTAQLQMFWNPCHSESQGREISLKLVGSRVSADTSWEQLGWVVTLYLAMWQLIYEPMGPNSLPSFWDLRVRV